MIAQAWGHNPGEKVLGAPQLYLFEPHQTEQMGWKPDTFLDITEVWDQKRAAIECMEGPAPPLGLLHQRRPEPRQPFPAQLRRSGRAGARRNTPRLPIGLPAHRG
jgi:LmbE family N-acetylglucosaminyl deacetylase